MKRIFILLILFLCITINSFAVGGDIYYRALTNLYGYSNNICTLEEKDIFNFQRLEQSIRILGQEDINDFESHAWETDVSTRTKIKATSLSNALRKYLKKYTGVCSSCCMSKNIEECDGTELQKLYFKELKKYGISVD